MTEGVERAIERHCRQIERCNQRGGRMLSVVDLIEARPLDIDLAAALLAAISSGMSFMVGALPGGAGKTTVMGALLNFVAPDVELVPAEDAVQIGRTRGATPGRQCWVCHEIGDGPYYSYLWGANLRAYLDLGVAGYQLATNLHADTFEQARDQLCGANGVAPESFRAMGLLVFLAVTQVGAGATRRVAQVWVTDGLSEHRLVRGPEQIVAGRNGAFGDARARLYRVVASGARTIREVRRELVRDWSTGRYP